MALNAVVDCRSLEEGSELRQLFEIRPRDALVLFPERIETDRLLLERLCSENVDVFAHYERCSRHEANIEEVTRYLPWKPHETVEETRDFVASCEAEWEEGTRAEYVIRPRAGEEGASDVAGACSLRVDWETSTGTPGIWLRAPFWGRGYAGERARALAALAFDRLDLQLVSVPVQDGNRKSRRAVEAYVEELGGQYDGIVRNSTRRPDGSIVDRHRYTITRQQYREATIGDPVQIDWYD